MIEITDKMVEAAAYQIFKLYECAAWNGATDAQPAARAALSAALSAVESDGARRLALEEAARLLDNHAYQCVDRVLGDDLASAGRLRERSIA